MTTPVLLSSGELDSSFGVDGLLSLALASGDHAQATALAIQEDGKYVVTGWGDDSAFVLSRFSRDGTLDTAFSGDGIQFTRILDGGEANDVAIQQDGRIVVVGSAPLADSHAIAVARYLPNGDLDSSFSGDGIQTYVLPDVDCFASSISIQQDGKLLVGGIIGDEYALLRFNVNGELDATFDSDGVVRGAFTTASLSLGNTLALQPDGAILIAGAVITQDHVDFAIARHLANGTLDTQFGNGGQVLLSRDSQRLLEEIHALAVQSDGSILLAGETPGQEPDDFSDAVLIRLTPNGQLDDFFAGFEGLARLDLSYLDRFNSLAIQADGAILVGGFTGTGYGEALIARYTPDGYLDGSFSGDGLLTTLFANGTSEINDIALDGSGRLVAVGSSYSGSHEYGLLKLDDALTDQTILAGELFTYVLPAGAFFDQDGNALTLGATLANGMPLPDWLSFDPTSGEFSGQPGDADFGTVTVQVAASDGADQVSAEFHLEITTSFIEALRTVEHARWHESERNGTGGIVTFSFMESAPTYASTGWTESFTPFSNEQRAAARLALAQYQEISGLVFNEVADTGSGGEIRFATYLDGTGSTGGYGYYPSTVLPEGGDIWLNRADDSVTAPSPGDQGFELLLHEIGHALGLKHPGDYGDTAPPYLDAAHDSTQFTLMSYHNRPEESDTGIGCVTPMLYDIAAIQFLYGANSSTRSGSDNYTFASDQLVFKTIWDGGGTDTLDASNLGQGNHIDLREGASSSLRVLIAGYEWLGPYGQENVTLAYGVEIENALGGAGNDTMIGNALNNRLDGGAGSDSMSGGAGDDTYIVDVIGDVFTELPGEGNDTVQLPYSWILGANIENLVLTGTRNRSGTGDNLGNTITGNAGNNILDGGVGADTLAGGLGDDTYVVDNIGDVIQESAGAGNDTVISSVHWTLGANLENLTLTGTRNLFGTGNDLDNHLTGNGGGNVLNGGNGADVLDGGSGNDLLTGGAGVDTFAFTTPLNALRNVDTLTDFTSEVDKIELSSAIFTEMGFTGDPGSTNTFFHEGATAQTPEDRILYDQSTGSLSYDMDGSGALAAVQFAVLSGSPVLLYTDFQVG